MSRLGRRRPRARRVRIAGCAVLAATVLGMPQAHASNWEFQPTLRTELGYRDNFRLLPQEERDSRVVIAGAGGAFRRPTERSTLTITGNLRRVDYSDDLYDRDELSLDGAYQVAHTARLGSAWTLGLLRDTTVTSEAGSTGFTSVNKPRELASMSGRLTLQVDALQSASLLAGYSRTEYSDAERTGLVDSDYAFVQADWVRATSDRFRWGVQASAAELTTETTGARDRSITTKLTGRFAASERVSVDFGAGPTWATDDRGELAQGTTAELGLHRVGRNWSIDANASQSLVPTGLGLLAKQQRVLLVASRRITERLSTGARASYTETDYGARATTSDVSYASLTMNINWRLTETVSLELSLGQERQDYEAIEGQGIGNHVALSAVWRGISRAFPR